MAARTISHPVPAELDGVDRIRLELERELAWTVFERNAEPLWQHVRLEVEDVLIHRWRDGDLVMWDNRAVLHRATGGYAYPDIRTMHRTVVAGCD